jgi:hypothetical protein
LGLIEIIFEGLDNEKKAYNIFDNRILVCNIQGKKN